MHQVSLQIQTVLFKNDKASLKRALDSLANAVRVNRETGDNYSRIVMVHGDASPSRIYSEEEAAETKAAYAPWFDYVYNYFDENTGTAKGHNRLFEQCTCDYIMIQNPDIQHAPNHLARMLEPFSRTDVRTGLVEARQVPMEHPKEYDEVTKVTPWSSTACVMIPSDLYRELGGCDSDTFFMYCDDVDLSWRIRLAGYSLIYQPLAPVFHPKQLGSHGEWRPSSAEVYYSSEASLLMCYKYSYDKRLERLLNEFSKSGRLEENKAAAAFIKRRDEGTLPQQLDPGHKVAEISDAGYAHCRYGL